MVRRAHDHRLAALVPRLLHNLMDTSFFYMGITASTLYTVGEPKRGGRQFPVWASRAFFGAFGLVFALFYWLHTR